MEPKLNTRQQEAYTLLQEKGSLQRGQGFTLNTLHVLERQGLATIVVRRDDHGAVVFWRATPVTRPAPRGTFLPGRYSIRIAVRHHTADTLTVTQILHARDHDDLSSMLRRLHVPEHAHSIHGTGGRYRTDRDVITWRELDPHVMQEFVYGGRIFATCHHQGRLGTGLWDVVDVETEETVATADHPEHAERRARQDLADLNRALRS